MDSKVNPSLKERAKELRESIIKDLERELLKAKDAIFEREAWLEGDHTQSPNFKNTYTKRTFSSVGSSDVRFDTKLANIEILINKANLSAESKCLINLLKKNTATKIEKALSTLEDSYDQDLQTNPMYIGMSDADLEHYKNDYNTCANKTKARMTADMMCEIDKIIKRDIASRPRTKRKCQETEHQQILSDNIKSIKKDISKRYLIFRKEMEDEEDRLINEFDSHIPQMKERGIPDAAIDKVRKDNADQIRRSITIKIKQFNIEATRSSRIAIAEEIETSKSISRAHIGALMSIYSSKLEDTKPQLSSAVTWDQAMLDIDSSFDRCNNNWDLFTNILRDYWIYISDISRKLEYDRLARLYAVLIKGITNIEKDDISLQGLRIARNKLHSQIQELDKNIDMLKTADRRKIVMSAMPKKRGARCAKKALIYDLYVQQAREAKDTVDLTQENKYKDEKASENKDIHEQTSENKDIHKQESQDNLIEYIDSTKETMRYLIRRQIFLEDARQNIR